MKHLYHFGSAAFLLPYGDREEEGISAAEWSGIKSNFNQLPYRRGLFAAAEPAYADQYALSDLFSPDPNARPWLIEVTLRDECLKPEAVVANVREIESNAAFAAWFAEPTHSAKFKNYNPKTFSQQCQLPVDKLGRSVESDNECTTLYDQFYTDGSGGSGIGLIRDHWWNSNFDFWVIRRRECVESVHASPQAVLKAALSPALWKALPNGVLRRQGNAEGTIGVLLSAVTHLPAGDWQILTDLQNVAAQSDVDLVHSTLPELLRTVRLCLRSGAKPDLDRSLIEFFAAVRLHGDVDEARQADQFAALFGAYVRQKMPDLRRLCEASAKGARATQAAAAPPAADGAWMRVKLDASRSPASFVRASFLTLAKGRFSCHEDAARNDEVLCLLPPEESADSLKRLLPDYVKEVVPNPAGP